MQKFPGFPTDAYDAVVFSADSHWLAAGQKGERDKIRLVDLTTGKIVRRIDPRHHITHGLAFSWDGRYLAAAGGNVESGPIPEKKLAVLQVWEVAAGKEIFALDLPSLCYSLAFSPDGRMLAAGHTDKSLRLWEIATGKDRQSFKGHAGVVLAVAFSPDGRRLAAASSDAPVFIWNVDLEGLRNGKD